MRRRLSNIAAAVSLMLCVATVVVWSAGAVIPLSPAGWPQQPVTSTRFFGVMYGGSIMMGVLSPGTGNPQVHFSCLGFQYEHTPAAASPTQVSTQIGMARVVIIPRWFIVVATLAAPLALTVFTIRRRRRVRAGHCPVCGYDLRATPHRCPECGAAQPPHNPPMQRTATASSGAVK
jgi:hypothetical protein